MPTLLNFLLRLLLLASGLVLAATVALFVVVLAAVWGLRSAWARLTGRPVTPFVMRMGPGRAFEEALRRRAGDAPRESRTPRADASGGPRPALEDVTDVAPRAPR